MPSKREQALRLEDVRRDFKYVKSTGKLYRLNMVKQCKVLHGWTEVGYECTKGYLLVMYFRTRVMAHRLAWFLVTGEWPDQIDHRDHDKKNNRWRNLVACAQTFNQENKIVPRADNSCGFLGVTRVRNGKFVAGIRHNGRRIHLGTRSTPEAAYTLYLAAKRKLHAGNTL